MGDALVMGRAFQQQPMIAEKIAMVGSEDHDGVVGQTAGGKLAEHASNSVIDHRDHAAAQRHRLAGFALVDRERGLALGVGPAGCALRKRPGHRAAPAGGCPDESLAAASCRAGHTSTSSGRAA